MIVPFHFGNYKLVIKKSIQRDEKSTQNTRQNHIFSQSGKMKLFEYSRNLARRFSEEIEFYRRVLRHPQTPRAARLLLGAAIAYAASPIDLIPDFIPVIGYLDDLIILPLLIWAALRLIPQSVITECRQSKEEG
jgi:uncharacterized membrane protein YkvA (DUF1232 family)